MGLFGIALLLATIAIVNAVSSSARAVVRNEMTASGAVYSQIWASRSDQLKQGAAVLAQDYGFRQALATADDATVRSALDNLRNRQGVDAALVLGADGHATSTGLTLDDPTLDKLFGGLDAGEVESGVLMIDGQPHQVVAAPVMAPVLIGWVVFAERLDAGQMRNLESLSAIPLSASVATGEDARAVDADTVTVPTAEGPAMRLARSLPTFDETTPAALILTYPVSRALKPYEPLFLSLGLIGLAGIALLMGGTWLLSLSLTRPISALDDALHGLQRGEYVEAPVTSSDEIGRLASSFNAMVGDLRDREARLTHMALHDQETGLPNRLALERRAAGLTHGWVMLFGIERFEIVRNAIGYDSMARLIATLGRRIGGFAGDTPVARVGAGVLGLVIETASPEEAVAMARRLVEAAQEPITVDGAPVDITLTAGVADRGRAGSDLASPVDRAAIALDQARSVRLPVAAFDPAIYGDPAGNLSLISELMTALNDGEVTLAYQPKYDFRAERITGVEALMRWTHPRRGFVPPDLFIGMAEETGHIRPLTEWAISRAIEDQRTLRGAGHDLQVSVNISGRLLSDESFADVAIRAVTDSGAGLCFEITETAVMTNPETALRIIDRFADAGIAISLDDYGSGLSSLAYLKQIRADELKIDKAFILGLDQSARDGLLVKSTIDLAHGLGLKVTAEGVETPTALALLRGMGCDLAQGYLIGRPVSLDAVLERLADAPDTTAAASARA